MSFSDLCHIMTGGKHFPLIDVITVMCAPPQETESTSLQGCLKYMVVLIEMAVLIFFLAILYSWCSYSYFGLLLQRWLHHILCDIHWFQPSTRNLEFASIIAQATASVLESIQPYPMRSLINLYLAAIFLFVHWKPILCLEFYAPLV